MNRFVKYSGVCLFAMGAITGCDSGNSNPGNPVAYRKNSGNCSFEFVNDYNTVVSRLNYAVGVSDLEQAQNLVNEFNDKYQGVVCQAGLKADAHLGSTSAIIDVIAKTSEWRGLITSVRQQNSRKATHPDPTPSAQPPVAPVADSSRDPSIDSLSDGITQDSQ